MTAVNVGPLSAATKLLVAFAEGNVDVPTTAAIIEHPRHGLILWDTGINDAVADPERGDAYWGAGLRDAFGTHGFTRRVSSDRNPSRTAVSIRRRSGPKFFRSRRACRNRRRAEAERLT